MVLPWDKFAIEENQKQFKDQVEAALFQMQVQYGFSTNWARLRCFFFYLVQEFLLVFVVHAAKYNHI